MTHEFSQPSSEQLQPLAPGEAWQEVVQTPGVEEITLQRGESAILPHVPLQELPEALDKIPPAQAKDPIAVIYAGNPRVSEQGGEQPQKSWERGTTFVVYGRSQQAAGLGPNNEVTKVAMRNIPRVFQVDTLRGTTSYVGDIREGHSLIVGRNTSSVPDANSDMSRMHFTLAYTAEGELALVDHSTNGTAVARAEQLDQTKEYTAAHDLGRTIGHAEFQQ